MSTSLTLIAVALATVVLQTWARPDSSVRHSDGIFGGISGGFYGGESGGVSGGISGGFYGDPSGGISGGISGSFDDGIDLDGIFGGFERFTQDIGNGIREGSETIRNFLDQAQQVSENVDEDVSENINELRRPLQRLIRLVNYELSKLQSTVKRNVLTDIVQQLQELDDDAESLVQRAEEVRGQQSQQINDFETNLLRGWAAWASVILQRAATASNNNQEVVTQSQALINEYINRYSNYFKVCADEVASEQQEYENKISLGVQQYKPVVESLVDPLLDCLRQRDSNTIGRICDRQTRLQLYGLKPAHEDAIKLLEEGDELLKDQYKRRYCVIETLLQSSLERYEVEAEIEMAIASASEGSGDESGGDQPGSTEGNQSGSDSSTEGNQSGSDSSTKGNQSGSDSSTEGNQSGSNSSTEGNQSGSDSSTEGNPSGSDSSTEENQSGSDSSAEGNESGSSGEDQSGSSGNDQSGSNDSSEGDQSGSNDSSEGDQSGDEDSAEINQPGSDDASGEDHHVPDDSAEGNEPSTDGDQSGSGDSAVADETGSDSST